LEEAEEVEEVVKGGRERRVEAGALFSMVAFSLCSRSQVLFFTHRAFCVRARIESGSRRRKEPPKKAGAAYQCSIAGPL
jgi:hypothetical protein